MYSRNEPLLGDRSRADFDAIVEAANKGNPEALDRLREVLDDNSFPWQSVANLGGHCESLLVNLIAGSNVLLQGSLLRQVTSMEESMPSARFPCLGPKSSSRKRHTSSMIRRLSWLIYHNNSRCSTQSLIVGSPFRYR